MSSDAENYGGFFQFPLCLLASKAPFEDILTRAIRYGVVSFLDKTDEDGDWRETEATRDDALKKAQNVIGFDWGNIDRMIEGHEGAEEFVYVWRQSHRKTCDVRVRNDLMFGARDDGEPTERELRILTGIFSAIGDKPCVKICWQSIQCRAAGWLTTPPADTQGLPVGPIYSRGQIERTIAELVARNLVACVTYRRGERFWSHRLTRDELWKAVQDRKLQRARVRAERAAHDAVASAAIKQALVTL
jgi:hypothetical protein